MSVVVQNSHGWFVDARSLIDRGYSRCIRWSDNKKSHVKCCFKKQCFRSLKRYENVNYSASLAGGDTSKLSKVNPAPESVTSGISSGGK